MEEKEMRELVKEHGVKITTIKYLLEEGVSEEDVDSILDLRNVLCDYGDKGEIEAQISVAEIVKAYHAVDKDLEILSALVEKATSRATDLFVHWWKARKSKAVLAARFTQAMRELIEEYKIGGPTIFDED